MGTRQLAVALRPKRFSEMVGAEAITSQIKNRYAQGVEPAAWMFTGPTGSGKTTIAKILALSLQCEHGGVGEPCDECIASQGKFWIQEVNAAQVTTKDEVEQMARGSEDRPFPPSRRRIILLDEAHKMSDGSQNLLLKYFEDAPPTTVWMIATTNEEKIIITLRRRCVMKKLRPLNDVGIEKLILKAEKFLKVVVPKKKLLVEKLMEAKVLSPALVLNAIDSVLDGTSVRETLENVSQEYDGKAICASLMKGDWDSIREETRKAELDELTKIRASVAGYLRKVLEDKVPGPRAKEAASVITRLAMVDSFTDATQGPATVAALYDISQTLGGQQDDD